MGGDKGQERRWLLGETSPASLLTSCKLYSLSRLLFPPRGKGPSSGEGVEEGILKGICKRGMENGAGPFHAHVVVVLLPDSTCRQESDLKPERCKRSPAGEWLLESHLLTRAD